MKTKNTPNKNKYLLIAAVSAVVIFVVGMTYWYNHTTKNDFTKNDDGSSVNYSPPTEEEKESGDTIKETVIQQQDKDQSIDNTTTSSANVIITDAGQYGDVVEVRAFIQNVYLDGTCTITFSKDSLTVTKKTPAYRDASTTICTNPEFKRSEFQQSGEWSVIVTYDATGSTGISEKKLVLIN